MLLGWPDLLYPLLFSIRSYILLICKGNHCSGAQNVRTIATIADKHNQWRNDFPYNHTSLLFLHHKNSTGVSMKIFVTQCTETGSCFYYLPLDECNA